MKPDEAFAYLTKGAVDVVTADALKAKIDANGLIEPIRIGRGQGQPGNTVSVTVIERNPHILPFGEYGVVLLTDGALAMPVTPGVPSRPAHAGQTADAATENRQ